VDAVAGEERNTTMRLNHINLCASDVGALKDSLEQHFSFRTIQFGKVPDHPGAVDSGSDFAMLTGQDGCDVVISQIEAGEQSAYPPQFHFGLMQDSAEAVHAKHAELVAAGYSPGRVSAGFEVFGAVWTAFYCPLGDGLQVEVNHRTHSDVLDA